MPDAARRGSLGRRDYDGGTIDVTIGRLERLGKLIRFVGPMTVVAMGLLYVVVWEQRATLARVDAGIHTLVRYARIQCINLAAGDVAAVARCSAVEAAIGGTMRENERAELRAIAEGLGGSLTKADAADQLRALAESAADDDQLVDDLRKAEGELAQLGAAALPAVDEHPDPNKRERLTGNW